MTIEWRSAPQTLLTIAHEFQCNNLRAAKQGIASCLGVAICLGLKLQAISEPPDLDHSWTSCL